MRTTSLMATLIFAAFTLSACNTMQGLGQDVKAGGQAMSNAATTTKEKMKE